MVQHRSTPTTSDATTTHFDNPTGLLSWETESERNTFLKSIVSDQSILKIILKTKDESHLLKRWYSHHSQISKNCSIIILDNNSAAIECLKFYDEIKGQTPIVTFSGLHNNVHDTEKFAPLYEALSVSCRYFVFLDSDEFLYKHESGKLIHDERLVDNLSRLSDKVLPASWIENCPGKDSHFQLNENLITSGLRWGKPIILASEYPNGYINHNCQIGPEHYAHDIDTRHIVLHLSRLSTKQRVDVNINKLKQRDFFKTSDLFAEVMKANATLITNRHIRAYVLEIQDALNRPFEDRALVGDLDNDNVFSLSSEGNLAFGTVRQEELFKAAFSPCSPHSKILNTKPSNSSETNSVKVLDKSSLSMVPYMTRDEIEVFERALSGAQFFLEFGSGGSTVFAAAMGVPVIHSVDSSPDWLNKVAATPEVAASNFTAHYVDIGKLSNWGNPASKDTAIKWPVYYTDVWAKLKRTPDVVLVDGRFRVACVLMTLIQCSPETKIIIHDFWKRREYQEVLRYLNCIDRATEIGVFLPREDLDWRAVAKSLSKFLLDYR